VIAEDTETKKRLVPCVMETIQTILDTSASSLTKQEIASRLETEGVVASDRTLDTALANLQQAGHLTVGKKGRKNTYALAKVFS
jgi:DNA-binding transcriptional regulator PaaX